MMPGFHSHLKLIFLLLLFFISSHRSDGRFLLQKQGKDDLNLDGFSQTSLVSELEAKETLKLMGVVEEEEEKCDENGDEECLKRRMLAEAHLDYIYTQHHKP